MQTEPRHPAFTVREVRPEEYEEAGRVTADAYREFVRPTDPDEDWLDYLGALADVEGRVDRTVVLVATEPGSGTILGCVTIEEDGTIGDDDEEAEPGASHIRMLGVDPAARGHGVGRALMDASVARARSIGKRFVTLRTTDRMTSAHRLYASMGFRRDPDRDLVFDRDFRLMAFRLAL